MTLGRLNHVGVATPSIERLIETYRNLLATTAIGARFDLPAHPSSVTPKAGTPAKAGVHLSTSACGPMDPGLRRDDERGGFA